MILTEFSVERVVDLKDEERSFPDDLSFFKPYLPHFVRETLETGGEAYVSTDASGAVSGLFVYDSFEKAGTIFTKSSEVFDCFYGLKPFSYLYAEMRRGHETEVYDIYAVDFQRLPIAHRFRHEVSVADDERISEMEGLIVSAYPRMNRSWVKVALRNGDRCLTVRLNGEIAGMGWLSFVNGVGRLHTLYVKPRFRRMGIGEDIVHARLLWLRTNHAHSAFSEISRSNVPSARIATKAGMSTSGQIFQYSRLQTKSPRRVEPS